MVGMGTSPTTSFPKNAEIPRGNPTKQRALEIAAEFFCLRTRDVAELLRGRSLTESDERSVRRTLSILHRDGFLTRLPHFAPEHQRGGVGHVYGLSDKGVEHAFSHGYSTASTKTFDEHSLRTLDHEVEITGFHIALHRFATERGLRYSWRQTDLKRTVHPDALFTIADPTDPDREFCYFLEMERSKFGNYKNGEPQILRKLGAYYGYFNSTGCEKEWGFRQYRVVIVQRTEARRAGLLTALNARFPHRMFWLATEDAYRGNIGGEIFKTPKDHAERSSSFLSA
jgi:Replication-relaxation